MSINKISVCTVSMNRLHHIRETLPANIAENINYPDIEFVLLDYNSSDGLEEWVRSNMMTYIDAGILKYYRTTEPVYFQLSHSRNMVTMLSSGDILCMMDGDNYAGAGYAHWINSIFAEKGKNAIVSAFFRKNVMYSDTCGKLSFHRDLLASVRGYDESFIDYGMEDRDLVVRLQKAGGIPVPLEGAGFMKFIGHSAFERIKNFHMIHNLEAIYLDADSYMNEEETKVLYFLKDNTFFQFVYKFQKSLETDFEFTFGGWYVEKDGYKTGTYIGTADGYQLISDDSIFFRKESEELIVAVVEDESMVLSKVSKDTEWYTLAIKGYSECINRIKYMENDEQNNSVNPAGWGRGKVFFNFDYNRSIETGY
ncbi:MAG: glycosyltransferase family 2 protein [Chitinophagaceae bacterium]|nr:glycosyltransferase family 2 protein [Chitinophagaceae bacterium]